MPKLAKSSNFPLFSTTRRTSITEEEQKELFEKYKKEGKHVFWGYIGCALWEPKYFNPKLKVGDKVYFYIGAVRLPKERQTRKTIRVIGRGIIFGFYDYGYWVKLLTFFLNKNKYIGKGEKIHGLHHDWVEDGEYIFKKLNAWSVS